MSSFTAIGQSTVVEIEGFCVSLSARVAGGADPTLLLPLLIDRSLVGVVLTALRTWSTTVVLLA
jgi:hypothetical protein